MQHKRLPAWTVGRAWVASWAVRPVSGQPRVSSGITRYRKIVRHTWGVSASLFNTSAKMSSTSSSPSLDSFEVEDNALSLAPAMKATAQSRNGGKIGCLKSFRVRICILICTCDVRSGTPVGITIILYQALCTCESIPQYNTTIVVPGIAAVAQCEEGSCSGVCIPLIVVAKLLLVKACACDIRS